jgi:serine/threonine protein kinase
MSSERPEAPLFTDGIGDRVVAADGATGELLQILKIRPALTAVPSFEFALRERTARLANFRHAYYARVRRIDRVQSPAAGLAVVSDHVEGTRLSEMLRVAHERHLQLDINAAICLIRQLVPAVALLHENARDVAHGLIAPERLVVTPHARLVIVEHVVAGAIEQLQFNRERLWQDFRIAMPPSAGESRFDHRCDVTGVGLVALALLLGRPLTTDDYPHRLAGLLNEARQRTALGEERPLSAPLRDWLARMLQIDPRRAFASAPEALNALEEVLAEDSTYVAAPVALETFLSRYIQALLEPHFVEEPRPVAVPQPAPPTRGSAPSKSAPESRGAQGRSAEGQQPKEAQTTPITAHARDLAEIIPAADLASQHTRRERSPLFDPDNPFNVTDTDQSGAKKRSSGSIKKAILAIAAVIVIVACGFVAPKFFKTSVAPATPEMSTLVVQSNPPGVQVVVDGVDRGPTPARISVTPGAHILELRGRGVPRVIPFNATAGAQVSHYLEFANSPETGQLRVESQPAGAKVTVDGVARGVAPLTITELMPGDHEVILETPAATARHVVSVQAGATAALVAPAGAGPAPGGPVSGWLTVKAPFSIEIREGGRIVGTTDVDRIMMAAGRHELQFVNTTLGYTATRVVTVQPGKVSSITADLPNGSVNLNAAPWAEVWIDGQRVGETPIGNLSVPIGPHEVVFKHPQFGEKRHAISVTLSAPVRLSVDMK